jgi:hypothetical protein
MRRTLAAVLDAAMVVVLGYIGFRLAVLIAPCHGNMGSCPTLTPLILLTIILVLVLYFGGGYVLWRCTPGERLLLE